MAESPTPASVRALGRVLTWVDDVQDALLTAAVLTRLGAVFYKPLVPVSLGLGAAAEAINIFALAGSLTVPGRPPKRAAIGAAKRLLGTQIVRGLRSPALQRAMPTIGEAVQIAQTTDQLFGIGVSLGPIMGLVQETIFGIPSGAEFTFQSGIRYPAGAEVFLRPEDQTRAEALQLHGPISRILRGARPASWILAAPDGISFSDRADALLLLSLVAELARGFLPESRWTPLVVPSLDRDRPATGQLAAKSALAAYQAGIDPYKAESYPVQGNPTTLSTRKQAEAIRTAATAAAPSWMNEAPNVTARLFVEQVATDLGYRMIRAFEGCPCPFETSFTPLWRAVIDSMEHGIAPPQGATKEAVTAYLTSAAALYEPDPTRKTPFRELAALRIAHFR
jgi:hypothetical protein